MKTKILFAAETYLLLSDSLFAQAAAKRDRFMRITFIPLFLFAALLLSVTNVQAQYSGTTGSLNYSFDSGVLTISGIGPMPDYFYTECPWIANEWNGQIKTVVIEEGVTSVGASAFYACENLTSVTLPESVTSIDLWAFNFCIKLASLILPSNLTNIGIGAFDYCSNLASITLPEGVATIGESAFAYCSALTYITIPNSVTSIGNHAFRGCSALTTIRVISATPPAAGNLELNQASCKLIVPSGAAAAYQAAAYWQGFTNISEVVDSGATGPLSWIFSSDGTLVISGKGDMPDYARYDYFKPSITGSPWFNYHTSIKTVVIQEGVTSIGKNAFEDSYPPCYAAFTQVSIPNSVTRIGISAFENCNALASVTLPAGVTSIGFSAFYNTGITSVTLPAGITSIEHYVFANCTNLASVTFLGNITNIGEGAFKNTALTSFTIPGGVTAIGQYTFSRCSKLTSITIPNSVNRIGNNAFEYCTSLTSITIPNSVTSMGAEAFYYCTGFTTVTIGSGIEYYGLETCVFNNCSALTTIRILTLTPPYLNKSDVFYLIDPACVLEVPSESKNLYMAAVGWEAFAQINEIVDPDLASSVVSASIASSTSMTINGTITNSSSGDKSASYYCAYGTDPNNLNQNTATQYETVPASGSLNVNTTITGLTNGTLYYYKLVAVGNRSALSKLFLSSPIPTSNLKLWLRADMAVSSASSAVSAWGDISGWNNDAAQSASANQPAIAENVINAKPALGFNGASSKLTLPASTSLGIQSNPYEMFIVGKSSSSNIQFLIAGGANEQFEYHLNGGAGARFIPVTSLYLDKGTAGDYIDGNAHVFSGRAGSGGGTIRVDGVDGFSSTGSLLSSNGSALLIGARSDGSYFFSGDIAEVILYNANLSSTDRNTVEQYLASRYGITSGALPVELTSFTAAANGNTVQLNWQTATEVNNYGFQVERQVGSMQNAVGNQTNPHSAIQNPQWEVVGFVEGNGNSNSPKEYSFVDENPPAGNIQYRLKQIDTDGSYEYYSTIAEVNYSLTAVDEKQIPTEFALLQNFPNPFNPSTTISYQIPVGTRRGVFLQLKVYDILGNEVATLVNEEKAPGNYEITFDAGKYKLSSGTYFYRINAGEFTAVKKLILMK